VTGPAFLQAFPTCTLAMCGFFMYSHAMQTKILLVFSAVVLSFLASCVDREEERKPVPPTSSASKMPWNRPQPGEGNAQFGGMLQKR